MKLWEPGKSAFPFLQLQWGAIAGKGQSPLWHGGANYLFAAARLVSLRRTRKGTSYVKLSAGWWSGSCGSGVFKKTWQSEKRAGSKNPFSGRRKTCGEQSRTMVDVKT